MRFDVITLFEPMFDAVTQNGITSRAMQRGLWSLNTWNPREETEDNHRTIDDRPFGGGPGMVMMAEPLARTLKRIRRSGNRGRVISFAPNGTRLTDETVRRWVADNEDMVLICGRYEGIDQRFLDHYVDETVSVGDFVLSGGELAAMILIDAVVRQLPGAINRSFGCAALHKTRGLGRGDGAGSAFNRAPCQYCQMDSRKSAGNHLEEPPGFN